MIQETLPLPTKGLPLAGKHILILLENRYEDLELWYPKIRLIEAGAAVTIAAPAKREYRGNYGFSAVPDLAFEEIKSMDAYDGVVVPGGFAPDMLRRHECVLSWLRTCSENGKLVAFICHAGWVPISAKIVRGRHVTGVVSLKDDFENAGAIWEDKPVVVDGNLISSRTPADLAFFCSEIINFLQNQ